MVISLINKMLIKQSCKVLWMSSYKQAIIDIGLFAENGQLYLFKHYAGLKK